MNNKSPLSILACAALLSACGGSNVGQNILNQSLNSAVNAASPVPLGQAQNAANAGGPAGSAQAETYKNQERNYAFTIPAGWAKQDGEVNSDSVLFMEVPLAKSCSFQVHMTRMQPDFPAEASVKASLASAKKDIQIDKLLSAKRRDMTGMEKGKKVTYARGWEIVEKGQAGGHQRIIYQAYDRQNYYLNMMAAANTEQFEACRPTLQKIIDSIKFGN